MHLGQKSQPGNRLTVTTERVHLCQSFWKGKESSPFPEVFSVPNTEGAEHYTEVFVPCWIRSNPLETHLAEHRAAGTDHHVSHLDGWFSCSTAQPAMLWQLLPSPGAGADLIPLCHLVCSTDLYLCGKSHFKYPFFSPCLTFCQPPPATKAPSTFYSGISHQTCLLNLSVVCHSV